MKKISDTLRKLADDIDKIAEKKKRGASIDADPETIIIYAFKRIGVPYSVAHRMYLNYSAGYVARKIFLYEYRYRGLSTPSTVNPIRWIQAAIKNDYEEPDAFLKWLKDKRENVYHKSSTHPYYYRLLELTS